MAPQTQQTPTRTSPHEENVPMLLDDQLSAKLEPFDSYWQGPADVERGYGRFAQYYKYNVLPHLPADRAAAILVVSCGPGYLVHLLNGRGYRNVIGIDSDGQKIAYATQRELDCRVVRCFEFVQRDAESYDAIVLEQELNHLTNDEVVAFLKLCHRALRPQGMIFAYGLNGANPMVGAENLAHNIDHFSTYAEHSLKQVLELGGFEGIQLFPMKLYVFWNNPLNYVGLVATGLLELWYRIWFKLYGKDTKIFSKKIAATGKKGL